MSRYIDAEVIPKLFDEKFKETRELIMQGENHLDNLAEGFTEADRVIRNIPTADVVEVVRCKDCRYQDGCNQYVLISGDEGELAFCSYGAKKHNL